MNKEEALLEIQRLADMILNESQEPAVRIRLLRYVFKFNDGELRIEQEQFEETEWVRLLTEKQDERGDFRRLGKHPVWPDRFVAAFDIALNTGLTIAAFDLGMLPSKDSLPEKALYIGCFQLVNDYKAVAEGRRADQPSYLGRGIATNILKMLIDWACAEGWDEIRAKTVSHIPPLMMWSNCFSVERYRKFGFKAAPSSTDSVEAALHQRRGYHGAAMKKMWEPYAHLSDEEVTKIYDVVLDLRKRDIEGGL